MSNTQNYINIILAVDENGGIGLKNKLPWYISDELKIFKEKTLNKIVIVGRKTLEELPILNDRSIFCVSKNFKNLKFKDYYYNYQNYLNVISSDDLKNIF